MTPWIEIDEVRTRTPEDKYRVELLIRGTGLIPTGLFVHTTGTGVFSHVATADELHTIQVVDRNAARAANAPRYRDERLVRDLDTPRALGDFLEHVNARLLDLTRAWGDVAGYEAYTHPGARRYIIGGEDAEAAP